MSIETVTEVIRRKLPLAGQLGARVKFDFGSQGRIYVDATRSPAEMSAEDHEADLVLSCTLETFEGILDGSQDPNVAFMFGRLKIQGNMKLALKLNAFLED